MVRSLGFQIRQCAPEEMDIEPHGAATKTSPLRKEMVPAIEAII